MNWTGGNGEFGRPLHPTLVAASPDTFAYPSPIAGTIPVWYDPVYWYQGVRPRFVLSAQAHALTESVKTTLHMLVVGPLILLLVPLLMLWRARAGRLRSPPAQAPASSRSGRHRALRPLVDHAYLALPLVGIATYLPLDTEPRYIAAYVAILVLTAFMLACARLRRAPVPRLTTDRVALATGAVAAITFAYAAVTPTVHVARQLAGGDAPGVANLRVARALTRAGIGAGDGIAFVGDSTETLTAYWARLDRARVVGNVADVGSAFWRLSPAAQTGRLALLRARSGARVAVTNESGARSDPGWVPIAGTGDYYRLLAST